MAFSEEQLQRYSRHFVLREIGVAGQKRLLASSVLVIGAGALGSASILYLASAGVGTIGIADHDTVELSNLQRQVIHTSKSVGTHKTESAAASVSERNPDVQVRLHTCKMTAENIQDVIKDYDFILDCTDRFETKFLINDACVLSGKPYCHAGVVRFEGQVMTYVPNKGPCLRCLLGGVPSPEDSPTCAEAGVLGAVTGIIGSIQALEAVKYILNIGEPLVGRVLNFNGLTMDMRIAKMAESDPDCAVCGKTPGVRSLKENAHEYEINGCN